MEVRIDQVVGTNMMDSIQKVKFIVVVKCVLIVSGMIYQDFLMKKTLKL